MFENPQKHTSKERKVILKVTMFFVYNTFNEDRT